MRNCLARADLSPLKPFDRFVGRIESSIDHFLAIRPQGTFREATDASRKIWLLSRDDDPSPGLLRVRLKAAPKEALEFLAPRARAVLSRLFPGEEIGGDVFEAPRRPCRTVASLDGGG